MNWRNNKISIHSSRLYNKHSLRTSVFMRNCRPPKTLMAVAMETNTKLRVAKWPKLTKTFLAIAFASNSRRTTTKRVRSRDAYKSSGRWFRCRWRETQSHRLVAGSSVNVAGVFLHNKCGIGEKNCFVKCVQTDFD